MHSQVKLVLNLLHNMAQMWQGRTHHKFKNQNKFGWASAWPEGDLDLPPSFGKNFYGSQMHLLGIMLMQCKAESFWQIGVCSPPFPIAYWYLLQFTTCATNILWVSCAHLTRMNWHHTVLRGVILYAPVCSEFKCFMEHILQPLNIWMECPKWRRKTQVTAKEIRK